MSPSTTAVRERDFARVGAAGPARGQLDHGMFVGIATALIAVVAGVAVTGISARYFFQPSSFLIVIGGTLGVMLMSSIGKILTGLFPFRAILMNIRCNLEGEDGAVVTQAFFHATPAWMTHQL